ncbi:MAG: cobalamin-dependent protein [Thermacetogeniaceae bacterium]|jgi:methanogenic corrinoid protein MtbC1|nr:cobalamin-binding protein [Syntrophomonadaceae bacterium]
MKKSTALSELIINSVEQLDEKKAMELSKTALKNGLDPLALLDLIKEGVIRVGKRYENQQYFIADLIMAGVIFKDILELKEIKQQFSSPKNVKAGKLLIGTVAGDLHDIGKNIFIGMMKANGFETIDLGVDVKKEDFVKYAIEIKPDIIGMSGVLTFTVVPMKETVEALTKAGIRKNTKIIIGGSHLTEENCAEIGADCFATDASDGVELCKKMLGMDVRK